METPLDRCLKLVSEALNEIDNSVPLSAIIRKCIRIARLRNDYRNLWWLEQEMCSMSISHSRLIIQNEMEPHFPRAEFAELKDLYFNLYIQERKISYYGNDERPDGALYASSIEELEENVAQFERDVSSHTTPAGMHPVDLYFTEEKYSQIRTMSSSAAADRKGILSRVRHRCHQYLASAERELLYGQLNSSAFEKNREYVDSCLSKIAPKALEMFVSIYRRLGENDAESKPQALLSCRRLLKALADALYPPKEGLTTCADGKQRELTDDKYISRLLQYVGEHCISTSSREVIIASLQDLTNRVESLYSLTCKGVHDNVSDFEVNQCAIQTYLLVGDLLRVRDNAV